MTLQERVEGYHFTPTRTLEGGSPLGNSYLSLWASCPRAWYNTHYRRDVFGDQVSTGIEPEYRKPSLSFGSIVHRGLEQWYLSGCRNGDDTGEYSIDTAIEAARLEHLKGRARYESDEQAEQDWLEIEGLLRGYHDRFGPTSPSRDWPSIRVMHDSQGKPIVERELWTPLGAGGRFYSVRVDLLISHFGFLKVMEHKTSVASYVGMRLRSTHYDSQMTGQFFVIAQEFPELPLAGILTNVLVKGRGKTSKMDIAVRETTTRTKADLVAFEYASLSILEGIDKAVAGFESIPPYMQTEGELPKLVDYWFPDHGTRTDRCGAYGGCQFLPLCHRKDDEASELRMFRPRTLDSGPQAELHSDTV